VRKRNKPRTHGQPYGVNGSKIPHIDFIFQINEISLPLTGPALTVVVGAVVEVVNLIPLGLIYSLLFVVACVDGLFVSSCCCSSSVVAVVVDSSLVSITRSDDSSNEGTIIGRIVSDDNDELSIVDSGSLLFGVVFVGGIS
jgi:hypothetical protein